jgi:hypothetical protein
MMLSVDGGANWSSMSSLDSLMTGAGQFKSSNTLGPTNFTGFGGYSQPSLVAFSSVDSQTLIAAGVDSGVFVSSDGGATWTTVTNNSASPGNPLIPRAQFASFDRTGAVFNVFIGTQGRGVWKVEVPESKSQCLLDCEDTNSNCGDVCTANYESCPVETPHLICVKALRNCLKACDRDEAQCEARCK